MNVTVAEIMTSPVMTVMKHQTAGHVAAMMRDHAVSAIPVVGAQREPLGVITATDLLASRSDATPVAAFMAKPPLAVHPADGPHVAARIMRNHHIHHVLVVDHHEVVGIVSAFDLLELVEEHRFVAKAAPTPSRRSAARR